MTTKTLQAARGEITEAFYEDAHVAGTHLRVLNLPASERGFTLQVARSLEEVDSALGRISRFLVAIALVGIAHRRRARPGRGARRARPGAAPDQDG